MAAHRLKVPDGSAIARTLHYSLTHWTALTHYLESTSSQFAGLRGNREPFATMPSGVSGTKLSSTAEPAGTTVLGKFYPGCRGHRSSGSAAVRSSASWP
jgi:hypothetical protein